MIIEVDIQFFPNYSNEEWLDKSVFRGVRWNIKNMVQRIMIL